MSGSVFIALIPFFTRLNSGYEFGIDFLLLLQLAFH